MRLKIIATVVAVAGAMAMLVAPADAAPKKKHVVTTAAGGTVFVSHDEEAAHAPKSSFRSGPILILALKHPPGERGDHDLRTRKLVWG